MTGDIILIQDADLEYSVGDYPKLIEPIMRGDVDFTLGCRHVPGQPVRVMEEMRKVARIVNAAHWAFTWFFNITYGTKLRDPFTMYKVFRSECIEGVEFVADRFDFDWELAGKLVRLGYKPIEIPGRVQRARSSTAARRFGSSVTRPRGSPRASGFASARSPTRAASSGRRRSAGTDVIRWRKRGSDLLRDTSPRCATADAVDWSQSSSRHRLLPL